MNLQHRYTVEDLLDGCRKGNRKAQELVYRSLASKMLSICQRYAKNSFEAEDMLQNGFVKVFNNILLYRGEGSFEGWIKRIIVNSAIEVYRKNMRSLNTIEIDQAHELKQQAFTLDHLEVQDLLELIRQLPDGYRVVFNMYAIEGYTHKEIAEALQISEGASKSQLSRARTWLKNKLAKMEGGNYGTHAG